MRKRTRVTSLFCISMQKTKNKNFKYTIHRDRRWKIRSQCSVESNDNPTRKFSEILGDAPYTDSPLNWKHHDRQKTLQIKGKRINTKFYLYAKQTYFVRDGFDREVIAPIRPTSESYNDAETSISQDQHTGSKGTSRCFLQLWNKSTSLSIQQQFDYQTIQKMSDGSNV